jgi:hypothetical protein
MITVLVVLVANHHLLRTVTAMIIMLINPCIKKNQQQEWLQGDVIEHCSF